MYSIKAVSQATGLSIETLRAWERRYAIVEPQRDPNGRRSYRPEDVIRLRKLRESTERGHPISKLSRLSDEELNRLLQEPAMRGGRANPSQGFAEQVLSAAANYRHDDCDQAIAMALALLPISEVVNEVLSPLLNEVGERWHAGVFTIAQERLVTAAVRKQVASVLDTYNRIASGPLMVFTTVTNERHELGILMCALVAASRGLRCLYLGPDLPAADIATVGERTGAAVITLGFVASEDHATAANELAYLGAHLPSSVEIWIGGGGVRQFSSQEIPARCRQLSDLIAFERQVDTLIGRH
jgi:MerR family transcriptional regulator, light-induced transcriptional regulator